MKTESVISTEIYGADLQRTLGEILAYCQVMIRHLILPVTVNLDCCFSIKTQYEIYSQASLFRLHMEPF